MWRELVKKAATKDLYVQTKIYDGENMLYTWYIRKGRWGTPGGRIEEGESLKEAAARELLERTGYKIDPARLRFLTSDTKGTGEDRGVRHTFAGQKKDLKKVGYPGQYGGYRTKINWMKKH
jgi:8-oxo-dGTP pyrophosphatase MutT (NUDIX family)